MNTPSAHAPSLLPLVALSLATAAPAADLDPAVLGKWPRFGGEAVRVVVEGPYAYVTVDRTGLVIFDVSDLAAAPLDANAVGIFESAPASGLAVEDGRAYMRVGERLVVIDAGDPARPRELGALDGKGASFAVQEGLVYSTHGSGNGTTRLEIIDAREPAAPRLLGSHEEPDTGFGPLMVAGNHVYYCDASGGSSGGRFFVFDVSAPARPRRLARLQLAVRHIQDLFVAGNHAYVTARQGEGLVVLDVSDPARPRRVGGYGSALGGPVFVGGDHAYVKGTVLDVSEPSRPRPVGLFDRAERAGLSSMGDLFVAGGFAYGTYAPRQGTFGLRVFDVRSPVDPERLGAYPAAPAGYFLEVRRVSLSGDFAYLAAGALHVVDVSDPARPERVALFEDFPIVADAFGSAVDVFVSGDHAYVARGEGGLHVLEVTDPAAPRHAGAVPQATFAVFASAGYAYAVGGGLNVIDVRDPAAPARVGGYDAPRELTDVFVAGGRAYAVSGRDLWVIDVGEPSSPRLLGTTFAGGSAGSPSGNVFVTGEHAWVAADDSLVVIDVSEPASPRPLSIYRTSESGASDLFVSGGRAFVAGRGTGAHQGFQVIDVSDPAAPRLAVQYTTFGAAHGISVAGGLAYVASGVAGGGLEIIDLRVPPAPGRLAGSADTSLTVSDVAVSGGHAFVADRRASLHVFDVTEPAQPRRVARYENERNAGREGGTSRVFLEGDLVCVLDHPQPSAGRTTLEVLDISDPLRPRVLGGYDAGFAGHSFVSGGFAYLAYSDRDALGRQLTHLRVIDARNPAAGEVGVYATDGGRARGLFVSAPHAYLSVDEGYELLDVRNPATPRLLRRFAGRPGDLFAAAGTVYVGYEGPEGGGIEILDAADPLNPRALGRYLHGEFSAPRIQVSGDRAYLSWINQPPAGPGGRFQVIDVSERSRPRLVGRYPFSELKHASGDLAFVEGLGTPRRGLEVIDLARPADPQRAAFLEAGFGWPGRLVLSGGRAYVGGGASGLHIIDVRDPSQPRRIGGIEAKDAVRDVALSGAYAYAADGSAGVQVIDVSEPGDPRRAGGHPTTGYVESVFTSGDLAYVGQWDSLASGSLHVVDVSEPISPRRLGGIATRRAVHRVLVAGQHAYALSLGLEVIDVSDPARPRLAAAYSTPSHISDMALAGNRLFLVSETGLEVLDVSDPGAPVLVGTHALHAPGRIELAGDHAYVATGAGLEVLDVRDATRPRRLGGNSAVRPWDIAARGDTVFVTEESGFLVLEHWKPFPPADVAAEARDGEVRLSWAAPNGGLAPAGYDVYRVSPGPRTRWNGPPITGTSFTAAGLENGVEHCFAVQALSAAGDASEDSAPPACATPRAAAARFLRGDCDGDGRVAGLVTDAVFLLNYSFRGGPRPPCLAACDADGDGRAAGQVTDAVYLLNYNFLSGPAPAAPFPECGPGTLATDEALGCQRPPERCN